MQDRYDVFVSYNSNDQAFVTSLAKWLQDQRVNVFLDRWHLVPGQPWPEHLRTVLSSCAAVAVCIGPEEMGPWQLREMYFALERQNREPGFPVIPLLLPNANPPLDFLSQNMWVDFRVGLDDQMALSVLLAAIRRETLDPALQQRMQESVDSVCPYRGLHFFREQDAAFFFGRDKAVDDLQDKLRHCTFVALVGASGVGKSSVVRAGLLPKLRQETRDPWEIVTIVPGNRPLYNLAAGLMPLLEPELGENELLIEIGTQAQAFLQGTLQVRDVLERILRKQPGTSHFLLVVDQWEELYTLAQSRQQSHEGNKQASPDQRETQVKRFIDGLLDASEAGVMNIVTTMRGDFMGQVISYRRLADRLQDAQINLGPMRTEELRQAIEAPSQKLASGFEPGLVDTLLADVGDEPGNLPLLEFVLEQLWQDETRRGGLLRHQAYRDMNRLKGALAQKADEFYHNLNERDRQQLRLILLQLVHSSENADYTRRRANSQELDRKAGSLVDQLIKERLLVSNRDKETQNNTLEIAHEALIRGWPRYQTWLEEEKDFLLWHERLRSALEDWQNNQDQTVLLGGQRLKDAQRWIQLKQNDLNNQERSFIKKSCRHAQWIKVKTPLAILAPFGLTCWFFIWSHINNLSPALGIYVILSKLDIYTLQPEMVTIPPGTDCQTQSCEFLMGINESDTLKNSSELPRHKVRFNKSFKMGRFEVTFNEYQVFAAQIEADGGCQDSHKIGAINDYGFGKESRPAIDVSWKDAQCYAQWLSVKTGKSYRLPTEAEWEYAARAGTSGDYYWDDQGKADDFAWFYDNSDQKTHPVGEKKPNAFGLYDMSGNVYEWVQDCKHYNYQNAPADGTAWEEQDNGNCSLRVLRGGTYTGETEYLRSALRSGHYPYARSGFIGFRLAQDLP